MPLVEPPEAPVGRLVLHPAVGAADVQDFWKPGTWAIAGWPSSTPHIDFHAGEIAIRVEATPDHGMATIWEADILIWAASQIVEARDRGRRP